MLGSRRGAARAGSIEAAGFAHRLIKAAGCVPRYVEGIDVYHQEPLATTPQPDRYDKAANPNWARICRQIDGYREFKMTQTRGLGLDLVYDGQEPADRGADRV